MIGTLSLILFCFSAFYEKAEIQQDESKPKHMIVALTSDRGLCGGVHSTICKQIKQDIVDRGESTETKLVLIGDKAKAQLQKYVNFSSHLYLYPFVYWQPVKRYS